MTRDAYAFSVYLSAQSAWSRAMLDRLLTRDTGHPIAADHAEVQLRRIELARERMELAREFAVETPRYRTARRAV